MKRLEFICSEEHVTELAMEHDEATEGRHCQYEYVFADGELRPCGLPTEVYWSGKNGSPVWSFRGPIRDL